MRPAIGAMLTVAAMLAAAVAGLWAGQTGLIAWPGDSVSSRMASDTGKAAPKGTVLYYQEPSGKPLYSPTPTKTPEGIDYVPVYGAEDGAATRSAAAQAPAAAEAGRRIIHYRNPMGLPDISPVPKKDSMGMDYIPVYADEADQGDSIKISPEKIQRSGVRTERVAKRRIVGTVRAPGVVQVDEQRISVVAPRFDGYIDKVGPVTSGARVSAGQPLMTIFGQELLNQAARLLIEQDYGASNDAMDAPRRAGVQKAGVVGAQRRLANLGAPPSFIAEVKRERRVPDEIHWPAPQDGVVLERRAVDGQGFKAGDVLFRIADLSVIWIVADVAEGDVGALRPGQPVKVAARAYPGRVFEGKVAVIYPYLAKETRTVRVRIALANPDLALLPDMYADVDIDTGGAEPVVAVPQSAVIDSGSRQAVIVDRGEGRFAAREVKAGRKGEGWVEIEGGLTPGETIVVDGTFLIDSESNLQAALKGLGASAANEAAR